MKTYQELLERRKSLTSRANELAKQASQLLADRMELANAVANYSQVYGFTVDFDEDNDDDIIQMNFRVGINVAPQQGGLSFKDQVLLIEGVTEVQELDRYSLSVRKGRAFTWGEIKTKLEDAWGAFSDPLIVAADKLNAAEIEAGDAPKGDVDEDAAIDKAADEAAQTAELQNA